MYERLAEPVPIPIMSSSGQLLSCPFRVYVYHQSVIEINIGCEQ